MNQAVYMALLEPGDTILAMDLSHGGHLTHGAPVSCMGKIFNFVRYRTLPPRGEIDFDGLRETAQKVKPKIVLCGHSSYPRELDYARFRSIADEVGALTMADVSHIGGLIAARALANPLDAGFDVVTTNHSQVAARSARRDDPLQVEARAEDRSSRVPGHARRPAYECGRRYRCDAEARSPAGVSHLCATGACEMRRLSRKSSSSAAAHSSPAAPRIT
jgi:hypothetical protein